jgi:hypothetical protein
MSVHTVFRAEQPVSVWNKPLKLDFKVFFKGLASAVADVALGTRDSIPKDLAEIVTSLGLETTPEARAWLLVYRSLTTAIQDLVSESLEMFTSPPKDLERFCNDLDFSLEDKPVVIDESLFLHPGDLPLLQDVRLVLQEWLMGYGLEEAQAAGVGARLRSYFVHALNAEWRKRPLDYATISELVNTPFTKAAERESAWNQYNAWLQRQVDASMFDEAFSLAQVYVPLRAYYEEKKKAKNENGARGNAGVKLDVEEESICHVVDLQGALDAWLKRKQKDDAIRVISGGPGCGKSSFAKMYAAHVAQTGETKVMFIPLHQFDPKDDLVEAVGDFAIAAEHFSYNPLHPTDGERRLLIIFDGLDELSKQGRVGAEIAQQFVREVQKRVELRNDRELHVQVLLSGRALFVQANASEFRKPEHILHVLPYYQAENLTTEDRMNDPHKLMKIDQRDLWWRKYGAASGKQYDGMPEELKRDELDDITAEPLLNYLFALTFTRGEMEITGSLNVNTIYEQLLKRVYHRGYAENRLRKSIPEMTASEFFCVLEEIGLAAWHGGGRTTTAKEIMDCCEVGGTSDLLGRFQEGAEKGVSRLLAAFYFREASQLRGAERAFEFTHKSFGEYLAVRRMVRLLDLTHNELKRRMAVRGAGWDYDHALREWAWLFGPAPVDEYLFGFLCRELQRCDISDVADWQQTLTRMIGYMLRNGMPMEQLRDGLPHAEQRRQARNAEEALLGALNACARCTREMSHVDWPEETSAGSWIRFLQEQRAGGENRLVLRCLSFLDMHNCTLYISDLYAANLSYSDLSGIRGTYACLADASLVGTDLRDAMLIAANLEGARLEGATVNGASFEDADLYRSDISSEQLSRTHGKPAFLPDDPKRRG